MAPMRSVFASFLSDRSGNFAITLGLVGTVLVAAIGGATDLSRQFWVRGAVQRAVDAAALAGAKELQNGTEASAKSVIQMIAKANVPSSLANVTFTPGIDMAAGTVSVTGDSSIKPNFLGLLSIDSLGVKASAASSIEQKQYTDFYFLLDVSESMNIAASEADRQRLEAITMEVTGNRCAFACHEKEARGDVRESIFDINQRAAGGPARLRIDVAREALDKIIDKLLAYNGQQNSLKSMRVATGGFGTTFQKGSSPDTNAAALKSSLRRFSVANSHTDYASSLAGFSKEIGTQGTGKSQSSPLKLALLVTDGVRDTDTGFRRSGLGPIDPTLCKVLKDKNITLAILEIKYVADRDESFFKDRVSWYYDMISPNLSECASRGYYFQASDADEAEAKLVAATDALLSQQRRLLR